MIQILHSGGTGIQISVMEKSSRAQWKEIHWSDETKLDFIYAKWKTILTHEPDKNPSLW